ncbi:anthrax toxin lethal factor-related metalloendopeptidase [Bacillus pretiosus]|uniref:ATLF-like domain-containing protein n=1 Tax=Bacillus pretiosus TaxID=2983392 RepID=A0ABT3ENV1_9BACI|nr:hypothetical protein [Bacillus pretiosus]MCW1238500.1 hypothetical protein [Bacillus pretiosus]
MKNLLIKSCVSIVTGTTFLVIPLGFTVHAQEETKNLNYADNHEYDNEEKYKEEIKTKEIKKWEDSLKKEDRNILNLATYTADILKQYDGFMDAAMDIYKRETINVNNDSFDDEEEEELKGAIDTVKKLDKLLEEKSMKSKDNIRVYKYLTKNDVNFDVGNTIYEKNNPTIVDRQKVDLIKKTFKYGVLTTYFDPLLTRPKQQNRKDMVLLDLKLPKNTPIGFMGKDGQIILQRNQGIEVTNYRIITERGREILEIEAKLVNKDTIDEKIKLKENLINDTFKQMIRSKINKSLKNDDKLDESISDNRLVKIHTVSLNASYAVDKAEMLLQTLVRNIPNDLFLKTFEKMNPNTAFYITDSKWSTAEYLWGMENSQKEIESESHVLAYYSPSKRDIVLNLSSHNVEFDPLKILKDGEEAPASDVQSLLHEFGHAVDNLIFNDVSKSIEFKYLFNKENANITIEDYAQTNPREFFASVFSYMFSPNVHFRKEIEQQAPETVSYIKNLILKNNLASQIDFE